VLPEAEEELLHPAKVAAKLIEQIKLMTRFMYSLHIDV